MGDGKAIKKLLDTAEKFFKIKFHIKTKGIYDKANNNNDENGNENKIKIGIIGTFSSGKSTFINSLLEERIMPTGAVQGTSTTIAEVHISQEENVIIYTNGEVVSLSENPVEIMSSYGMESQNDMGKDSRALFKMLVSSEIYEDEIDKVQLYINNSKLPRSVVLVDTPGLDSLDYRHDMIVKNELDEFDMIAVVITADKPAPQDLISYVKNNLEDKLDRCIFVVTKIETIYKSKELKKQLKVIRKRLKNMLGIRDVNVFAFASLLNLIDSGSDIKVSFLEDISNRTKRYYMRLNDKSENEMYAHIEYKRQKTE